jgi:hypothetical protein
MIELYKSEKYHILIFQEKKFAFAAFNQLDVDVNIDHRRSGAVKHANAFWSKKLNTKVMSSNLEDIIFVIEKIQFSANTEIWHAIIGEKVGWIVVPKWTKVKPLGHDQW